MTDHPTPPAPRLFDNVAELQDWFNLEVSAITDTRTLLGEIACLGGHLRMVAESGTMSFYDAAVAGFVSLASRMHVESDEHVDGALETAPCTCNEGGLAFTYWHSLELIAGITRLGIDDA